MNAKITHISWGRMEVTLGDQVLIFKDCKVWPDGACAWDWRETGTHHQPGIQPADIQEILDRGVETMVLSRGMELRLRTTPEARQLMKEQGVEFHIEETGRAVELFNRLSKRGMNVGGLFHSTC